MSARTIALKRVMLEKGSIRTRKNIYVLKSAAFYSTAENVSRFPKVRFKGNRSKSLLITFLGVQATIGNVSISESVGVAFANRTRNGAAGWPSTVIRLPGVHPLWAPCGAQNVELP